MTITSVALTNPGAEAGSTTGWTVYPGGEGFYASTAPDGITPHSGSYAFGMSNGSTSFGGFTQNITVDVGMEAAIDAGLAAVRVSGWFNNDGSDVSSLAVQFYDGSAVLLGSESTGYTPSDPVNTWEYAELYVAIPEDCRVIQLFPGNIASGFASRARWDDFELDISDDRMADWPSQFAPQASQLVSYAFGTFVSEAAQVSQVPLNTWSASETSSGLYKAEAHQLALYAWAAPRPRRRRMQAWTFSLDGHDFYVLDLSGEGTIVLDIATGQWSEWRSPDEIFWRARIGQNWLGIGPDTMDRLFGTNIVVGDKTQGLLWILDPTQGFDDAVDEEDEGEPFIRYVTGLVQARVREATSCAGVYLNLSLGAPTVTGASIQLRTSDDGANSWYDHGTVTITPGDYNQEVAWRGLGLIRAPGRVFELTDSGASVRINSAEMT